MKLWILYNSKHSEKMPTSTQKMIDSAIENGINAEMYFADKFLLTIENNLQKLYYNNEQVKKLPDIVFSRTYNNYLLTYLERNGCLIINSNEGLSATLNKYESHLKVAQLKTISQPKSLLGNYTFEHLVKTFNGSFIMKDNINSKGKRVFLVENETQFNENHKNNPTAQFIYQEFISTSFGKSLRCYVVGKKTFSIMKKTKDPNNFKTNIYNNTLLSLHKLSKNDEEIVLKIAQLFNIKFGSVDFLLGENNELIFLKTNGNAGFKAYTELGIDLRKEFFNYLLKEHSTHKNIMQQKKSLKHQNNSFEILEGNNSVMISAPHNIKQIRNLKEKNFDIGTGLLLLEIHNNTNSSAIIKTNCKGIVGKLDDDANYEINHPYKIELENFISQNNIKYLIDLHSMKTTRAEQINFGIDGGKNINNDFELLHKIKDIFYNNGYLVSIDHPFTGGEHTVSGHIAEKTNALTLQIEINSKLINLKNEGNEFKKVSKTFEQVIKFLKDYDKDKN